MTTSQIQKCDFVVVGGGIAGLSIACELSIGAEVVVLEAESQPGYHSTGRSAAMFIGDYGSGSSSLLSRLSFELLHDPPVDFAAQPILSKRGRLRIADAGQLPLLRHECSGDLGQRVVSVDEALALVPILRRDRLAAALFDPETYDIDVHGLLLGYLSRFKRQGGQLFLDTPLEIAIHAQGCWRLITRDKEFIAPVIVNAAGAWADDVAELCDVPPLDFVSRRRSMIVIPAPADRDVLDWPLVEDMDFSFYFRPEGGKILICPADATAVVPSDISPTEFDQAIAIEKFAEVTTMDVSTIDHSWAGLRTFAPDFEFVNGWESDDRCFYWLAGQGGAGIQTAPAMAAIARSIITGQPNSLNLPAQDHVVSSLSPQRLRRH